MEQDGELVPIGRFARRARLSVDRLRRYHELGLLEPALVDAESGYRYYSPGQLARAEAIVLLRALDMPLAEVQRVLEEPSDVNVAGVLARHRNRLEERLAEARDRLRRLDELDGERRWIAMPEPDEELVEVSVKGVLVDPSDRHDLVLAEVGGERELRIWIGPAEAISISERLQGVKRQRPMSHDLMASLLEPFALEVARVVVVGFQDEAFRAEVHLRREGREAVVDARPSDAVGLAVRAGAPILVAAPVFDAHPSKAPPDDAVHFELRDEEGNVLRRGWGARPPQAGQLRIHHGAGRVDRYEILEVQEVSERHYVAVARHRSSRQADTDVPG